MMSQHGLFLTKEDADVLASEFELAARTSELVSESFELEASRRSLIRSQMLRFRAWASFLRGQSEHPYRKSDG